MQVGPSNRDYFFVGLTALDVAASLYGNHSIKNVALTAFVAAPLGFLIARRAGNKRYTYYINYLSLLYANGFGMGQRVSWKVHVLAQALIAMAHEVMHVSAIHQCLESLISDDKNPANKMSESVNILCIPLSDLERQQLELSLYLNVLPKIEESLDLQFASEFFLKYFQFLGFEAYFSLYKKFRKSNDLAKAWAYATQKKSLPDVVQCYLIKPDFEKDDEGFSLTKALEELDTTDPSYLFVFGYLYQKDEVKDIQRSVDAYIENLEKQEADSLTFYQVLGLSVAAAIACEDHTYLMDALRVSVAKEEDPKPETAEELLSKSYLIPKALQFLDTLSENRSVSIPEKVEKIRLKLAKIVSS